MGAALLVGWQAAAGLLAEAVGVATGCRSGTTPTPGHWARVLGVPVVVPLAWVMMAWPALVVARTLVASRSRLSSPSAAVALAAWDVFLDPQMVAAGHWTGSTPRPGCRLVPGIPLTNYVGWLLVSVGDHGDPEPCAAAGERPVGAGGGAVLWVYFSSVLGHVVFFGLPGSAITGGVIMGAVAVPFAVALVRRRGRTLRW